MHKYVIIIPQFLGFYQLIFYYFAVAPNLVMNATDPARIDRNFDDIADHFAQKIYGGLKGQIRLAVLQADLEPVIENLTQKLGRPVRILDIGAGLAQMSLHFARLGHHATITDISDNMLTYAKQSADKLDVEFITCPYQELLHHSLPYGQYDVIFCHALLEWLGDPHAIMPIIEHFLGENGVLSLCFYNPASPIYRNLMMGNFNHLDNPKPADDGSLTPNYPVDIDTVKSWLGGYRIISQSGVRVFYDYTTHKRGGLANPEAIIAMELKYRQTMPFSLMGRYIHLLAVIEY